MTKREKPFTGLFYLQNLLTLNQYRDIVISRGGENVQSNMAADTITVKKAIEFLNWHNYNCSTCHKIAVLVESQANEIKMLRCCGTCERYEVEFEGCGKKQILVYRQQTCEDWEQMIIPNDNGSRIGECKKWEAKK